MGNFVLYPLDSLQKYVLMRGFACALFEQFCKIMRAHVDNGCELPEAQVLSQVVADIIEHTSQPISWQTPSIGDRSVAAHGVAIKPVGGAKVVRSSPDDQVTLIGAGVTLHNCLAAADELKRDGISARVVDLYSVKPIDTQTLLDAAAATGDRLVVVEDHYPAGGIGSAVLEALNAATHPVQVSHLAVRGLPGSGTPAELMLAAGISADHVVAAARKILAA
jgi:transketolase C-terminal domain/subunit